MPTGLFDDLIEEPKVSIDTKGIFDDLVDRDEGTTISGKYFPPEERKGVEYEGHYYPSMFELEKEKETSIRKTLPKGIVAQFREGLTEGTVGSATRGGFALTQSDDELKNLLMVEQERLKASEGEPTLPEKASKIAGHLLGTGISAAIASRAGKPGMAAFFGAQSAGDSFLKAGLRAMAEGKSPDDAVKIARAVAAAGGAIGAVEAVALPTGAPASVGQLAKQAGVGGGVFGAGTVARNIAERAAGLETPLTEGVPQAALFGAGFPVAAAGIGRLLRPRAVPPPVPQPEPAPAPPPVPTAPQASPPIVSESVRALPRGEPSGLTMAERPTQPEPSRGEIKATPELLDVLPPARVEEIPVSEFLNQPVERGPARNTIEELGQGIRSQKDVEAAMRRREEMGVNLRSQEAEAEKAALEQKLVDYQQRQKEITEQIRKRIDFEKARAETVAQQHEAIVHPDKPLTENQLRIIDSSLKKAILENQIPGERPGFIAGTALEKWADDVMSSEFRGRLSINPVDLLAKEIPALAIKGAALLEGGLREFPAWSAEMTKLYGDEFKPLLRKVYMQSLQVKGNQPNAVLGQGPQILSDLRSRPIEGEGQVPQAQRLQETGPRSQPVVQPGEAGQAQVPLTEVLTRPVQEVAANYENLLGDIASYGVEKFNRDLAAKVKTPEDVAALKSMAESFNAKVNQLKKEDFPEAVRLAGFQPMEAVKFAEKNLTKGGGTPEKAQVKEEAVSLTEPAVPPQSGTATPSRGIAASAREALKEGNVPHGTESGFIRPGLAFKKAVDALAVNDPAAPPVIIDETSLVPRLQPWTADKLISSSPEGVGRIPGIGRLFDPRTGAHSQVDRAIITNAKERGVGETVAALWGEANRERNPFVTDKGGSIDLAGGVKGHISDVIEAEMRNPGSQPLTPEQRGWITEVWTPLLKDVNEMLTSEGVKGFDVAEGEKLPSGSYFPRIAIGKKETSSGTSRPGGGSVGGKQFFQKERQYDSEAEGARTTIYEPDAVKRVSTFIQRAYKAIADHRLAQDESLGGRALSDGPPLFQKEGLVMQPAFSGKVFPKETADRLNSFYGQSSRDWVNKLATLNDAAKAWKLTLDLSAPLTQGLPVLFNNPTAWARSTGNSFRAMLDPNHLGQVLNRPEMKQAASELAQLGVRLGRLQDFMAGAEKGSLITKVPGVGKAVEATGRSFGAFMDLAKIEMWRGIRETVPKEQWPKMAELVENLTGTGRMETIGISPSRALGERMLLLAPTYYRAGVSLVATALQGGVAGNAARAALARFGTGVVLTSVAGMLAAGLSWEEIQARLNPSRGKFLKVPVKAGGRKVEVGFGHLLISLARLAGDTIEEANSDKPIGTGVENEPWKKWLRNHSAPVPSTLIDLTTGSDVMGNEVGTTKAIASQFVPITAGQALGPEGTVGQRAFDASMSFFGMNAYPQSVREQFRNERDSISKEKFGKAYESLSLGQQANIHRELSKDQKFKSPPANARTREMALQNSVERQSRLLKSLPKETQKQIQDLGLHVTGYEPRIKMGETDLPLTQKQAEAYEKLIAEEYGTALKTVPWTNWSNLKPERRQEKLNEKLVAAKAKARTKFKNQAAK